MQIPSQSISFSAAAKRLASQACYQPQQFGKFSSIGEYPAPPVTRGQGFQQQQQKQPETAGNAAPAATAQPQFGCSRYPQFSGKASQTYEQLLGRANKLDIVG